MLRFEANSLMQRVTVNDCHPCGMHPLPCSLGGGVSLASGLKPALARPR